MGIAITARITSRKDAWFPDRRGEPMRFKEFKEPNWKLLVFFQKRQVPLNTIFTPRGGGDAHFGFIGGVILK